MFYYLLEQGTFLDKLNYDFLNKHPHHIQVAIVGSICYVLIHIVFFSGIMNSFSTIQPYFWALLVFDVFLTNASSKEVEKNTKKNLKQTTLTNSVPNLTTIKPKKHVHFQDQQEIESETNVESEIDFDLTEFEQMIK